MKAKLVDVLPSNPEEGVKSMQEFKQYIAIINTASNAEGEGAMSIGRVNERVNSFLQDGWRLFTVHPVGTTAVGDILGAGLRVLYTFVREITE